MGITVDDIAVGGHLEALEKIGVETSRHYWLTDRRDLATDKWAEKVGIRVIRYNSSQGDHSEVAHFFRDLLSFVPREPDDQPPPVALKHAPAPTKLPTPEEILKEDAEKIRWALNLRAVEILREETEEQYVQYEEFSRQYDEAIYRAWYTSTEPGRNDLLGYKLTSEVARGAFGKVYRAKNPTGDLVAVKVLLAEIRDNADLLKAFRRGVRSMRILAEHQVEGMVAYTEASEIPAFVAMEWIEGPNLSEAKQSGAISDWVIILRIATELTSIVRRAHSLPERVLHRDIRPANIMLSNFYVDPEHWHVVVLDFDLSWHRGAQEKSVLHTTSTGYLAPEQIQPIKGASTRSATVDSFGIGMTFLYMCNGNDPLPDEHRHREWEAKVYHATASISCPEWRSLPTRFARIILAATQDRQTERWDLSQIADELRRLSGIAASPMEVFSAELVAEEVAARSRAMKGYTWKIDRAFAEKMLVSGVQLGIRGNEESEQIELVLTWSRMGHEDRRHVGRYIPQAARNVYSQLISKGWTGVDHDESSETIRIRAQFSMNRALKDLDWLAASIDEAADQLRFD